jgi:hypothetical protein
MINIGVIMKRIYLPLLVLAFLFSYNATAQVSWELKGQNLTIPSPVEKAGNFNGTIFAVGGGRISRSTDGGATFTSYDNTRMKMSINKYSSFDNVLAVGYQNSGYPYVW